MNKLTGLVVFLLMSCPVYSREVRHAMRLAAETATETDDPEMDVDDSDDEEMDDSDDEQMDTDDGDDDNDDMDTDENMDTGDEDSNDANMDDDDDLDDMDEETNSVQNAILAAIKSAALKQSPTSLGKFSAALDSGLSPKQTISQVLEPADSGSSAETLAGSTNGSVDASNALEDNALAATDGELAGTAASSSGDLRSAAVPEPAGWMLFTMAVTAAAVTRRRRRKAE